MPADPDIQAQSYSYFTQEGPELLAELERELLDLKEGESNPASVHAMMRLTHTLKGIAAVVGLDTIKQVAHSLEDIFRALCQPDLILDAEINALLFEGYECLRSPLMAELTGARADDNAVLERTAEIFALLQEKLGDCFDADPVLPGAEALGIDLVKTLFETSVIPDLQELETAIASSPDQIGDTLRAQAIAFAGIAEATGLKEFEAIATATQTALDLHPDRAVEIATLALANFKHSCDVVLAGDRELGGQLSPELATLAGEPLAGIISSSPFPTAPVDESATRPEAIAIDPFTSDDTAIAPHNDLELDEPDAIELADITEQTAPIAVSDAAAIAPTDLDADALSKANTDDEALVENLWGSAAEVAEPEAISPVAEPVIEEDLPEDDALVEDIWGGKEEAIAPILPLSASPVGSTPPPAIPTTPIAPPAVQVPAPKSEPQPVSPLPKFPSIPAPAAERSQSESKPSTPPQAKPVAPAAASTVRVNVDHLEQLNYFNAELLTNQNQQLLNSDYIRTAIRKLLNRLRNFQSMLGGLQELSDPFLVQPLQIPSNRGLPLNEASGFAALSAQGFDTLEMDNYSELHVVVQSIMEEAASLELDADDLDQLNRRANQVLDKQRKLLTNSRDVLLEARMSPLGDILNRFHRVLQQLSTLHKKPVNLVLSGTEVLVDKAIAERLYDPLLHLVRNAFDHGIEREDARQQQGKTAQGTIEIRASYRGSQLSIDVSDDGCGLNFDRIRDRAIERNLVSGAIAHSMTEAQLAEFLFEPGFSTASQVSDLSGRGVGLDVVRVQLQSVQGVVSVQTEAGRGTTFSLQIPLSLTTDMLLLCEAGESVYAISANTIEQILLPKPGQIQMAEGGRVFRAAASAFSPSTSSRELIPIYRLSDALNGGKPSERPALPQAQTEGYKSVLPLLLISCQGRLLALEVDRIVGEQELAIRPLNKLIPVPSYIYGGSILADGQLTLVIDSSVLLQHVRDRQVQQQLGSSWQAAPAAPKPKATVATLPSAVSLERPAVVSQPPTPSLPAAKVAGTPQKILMVVDDSVTLRQTLALTLQKSGYQVIQARDGREAIAQTRLHDNIDLIVCDIEMPNMNGFEFLSHRGSDPTINGIPVVILSSRMADKYKLLAESLGANAYLTKPYSDRELLDTVSSFTSELASSR
ncbi:MAG: hybrid sensor histidine kinase/response regulator [Cyanobacteria bacterium J06639_1]